MNIIFFGTGEFGVKPLEALAKEHNVKLVVTQADSISGRHLKLRPSPVKIAAQKLKLNIYEPENPNSGESLNLLEKEAADLFIVVDYGHILKKDLLSLPKLCSLNIHPSLLPKYRGAAPINWAIANGETETGVTIIRMNTKADAGEIALQKKYPILAADNAISLAKNLSVFSQGLIIEAIEDIKNKTVVFLPQENSFVSFAPKLKKDDGLIDWKSSARDIINYIRAFIPWPSAFTYYQGEVLKILNAVFSQEGSFNPGEILQNNTKSIIVGTGNGALEILELQLSGGKKLESATFLRGHRLLAGEKLG